MSEILILDEFEDQVKNGKEKLELDYEDDELDEASDEIYDEKNKQPSDQMRYGEREIKEFDVERDLEIWQNKHERDYMIKITLPEFCCLCPRSGYPDFATIYIEYMPAKFVVELKAIKLYINSFMNRNISHEDSINEIYDVLYRKLAPKYMKIVGDFNPRGNVHTVIEITSENFTKTAPKAVVNSDENKTGGDYRAGARRIEERERDRKRDEKRGFGSERDKGERNFGDKRSKKSSGDRANLKSDRGGFGDKRKDDKSGRGFATKSSEKLRAKKDGVRSISYAGERKASVVKKDS